MTGDNTVRMKFGVYAGCSLAELPEAYRELMLKNTEGAKPGTDLAILREGLLITAGQQEKHVTMNREWNRIKKNIKQLRPLFKVVHHT